VYNYPTAAELYFLVLLLLIMPDISTIDKKEGSGTWRSTSSYIDGVSIGISTGRYKS